jgi:diguanylate cyclase (GGDEF)-like protein/PAS domain S-box-containing protein
VAQAFIGVVSLVSLGIALVRAELRRATQEAEATADRLRRTIDNAVIAHLTVGAGADGALVIGRANPAASVLLGTEPGALPGRSWLDFVAPEDRDAVVAGLADVEAGARAAWVGEVQHVRADGGRLWALVTAADMEHEDVGGGTWHVVQLMDVTAQNQLREELAYRVLHDELTGLATRELLHLRIADALATGEGLVLLYLDLDDFKSINDTMGHAAGDAVIAAVAGRLRAGARPGDTVARLGGDEFVVCCPGSSAVAVSADLARRALDAVRAPISVEGRLVSVTASVGVATAAPGDTLERVLRAADTAMYAVKHRKQLLERAC